MKRIFCALVALILITALILPTLVGCTQKTDAEKMREVVAVRSENFTIDGSLMTLVLVSAAMNLVSDITEEELIAKGFDADLNFNEQYYEGETTWFDFFLAGAEADAEHLLTCLEYAHEKGLELSENDLAAIESEITNMRIDIALNSGLEISEYLDRVYCGYVELEDYRRMRKLSALANLGAIAMSDDATASVSEADVTAARSTVPESERDTSLTRKLCSILTNYDTYQDESSLKPLIDELNGLLSGASDGQAKLDAFGKFAEKYDVSGTHLFENVMKGDMLNELDEWLFDPTRNIGDVGIVESDYGYHIMYYAADDDPVWIAKLRGELIDRAYESLYSATRDAANITVDRDVCYMIDY